MSHADAQCPTCEGKGYVPCNTCHGRGSILKGWRANPNGSEDDIEIWEECPECYEEKAVDCPDCRGTGRVSEASRSVA